MSSEIAPHHLERREKFRHLREVEFPLYLDVYLAYYKKISFSGNRIPNDFTQEEAEQIIYELREKIIAESKGASGMSRRNKIPYFMKATQDILHALEYFYETPAPSIHEAAKWIEELPDFQTVALDNARRQEKLLKTQGNL